jgi:hypothetical protein
LTVSLLISSVGIVSCSPGLISFDRSVGVLRESSGVGDRGRFNGDFARDGRREIAATS